MQKLNVIFFDGISGSGKSTTSQLIYLDLLRKGADAKWYYEHAAPHPVVESREVEFALQNQAPPEAAVEQVLDRAAEFVNQLNNDGQIHLFESCIYQLFAGCLFRMNQGKDEILQAVQQFEECFSAVNAQLVYFVQPDVGAALRRIAARRGEGFDQYLLDQFSQTAYGKAHGVGSFDQLIEAYVEFRTITDALFEASTFEKIQMNTSEDNWSVILHDISRFVSDSDYQGPAAPTRPLDEYAGTYQETSSGHQWKILANENGLQFDDAFQMKALPFHGDVFLLESTPIELRFEIGEGGRIETLRCEGNVLKEPVVGTVWKKIS
ncbi:MAG: hypothetical protein P9L94_00330 [Candidatus Hinthialibacter antarcticus]|nr:hypothetical protein [Candidatus Hinthialibacter antarcticus]